MSGWYKSNFFDAILALIIKPLLMQKFEIVEPIKKNTFLLLQIT
jgi:hypothetical protein